MFILILGCVRSGTKFISTLLQENGVRVSHEGLGSDGIVSGDLAAIREASPTHITKQISPQEAWSRRTHAFHQVRAPLPAIRSIATITHSWGNLKRWLPQVDRAPSQLQQSMWYWYLWNRRCSRLASWTYRVEQFPEICSEFSERLGREIKWPRLRTDINTRPSRDVYPDWDEAALRDADESLYERITRQAQRFGYETVSG